MGLTIHYQLTLSTRNQGVDDFEARRAAEALHTLALTFKRQGRLEVAGRLGFGPGERRRASEWRMRRVRGQPNTVTGAEVRPVAGHLFQVAVGRDCEPLLLGLGRSDRGGWRLKSFCKTQYASLHGWEHFQRCHTAVIDLLADARQLGLKVQISDEGGLLARAQLGGAAA